MYNQDDEGHLTVGTAPNSLIARGTGLATLAVLAMLATLLLGSFGISQAQAQDRTLSLYNTHTHERLTVTYKRNGRFVQAGLNQLNRFLRDWRRDEVTRIDPDLFDIVWTVYREVGASEPIHVVSAYRSPATNNMLRQRSGGVARNSQHTQGRAMDFFIPGVSASAIRAAGLRQQQGGVGYYPRSNTPFVHLDTGTVRMWPRMTRSQLARVFPNGRTIHVPADGRPMPGFEQAQRELQRSGGRSTTVASTPSARSAQSDGDGDIVPPGETGGGFLAALFGGGNAPEPPAPVASASATQVASVAPSAQANPVEVATAASLSTRERYAAPSPLLPPNVAPAGGWNAPSTVAGLAVPSPTPAPTIDDIQLAALGTPDSAVQPTLSALSPAASAVQSAFATAQTAPQITAPTGLGAQQIAPAPAVAAAAPAPLPPITREQQIAQNVPAPGQIAAIIEARFAERRAAQASLANQVEQAVELAAAPAAATATSQPPQPVQLASAPRFEAPVPAPAPRLQPATSTTAAPTTLVAANAPAPLPPTDGTASSLIAAAFAAQEQARTPAQTAIDAVAGSSNATDPVQLAQQVRRRGITGQLYPLSTDLSAALAKQSIRGSQHATLVRPSGQVTLSPTLARSSGFQPTSSFQLRSDGFGAPTPQPGS
jgi:uncharacterized protein YcbK (DUF882 family)